MTRYFPLFLQKRGLTVKKGGKKRAKWANALLKGQPFFKRANWGPWDKGTSVISLTATTTATAMFPNADNLFSNCVENPSRYN